MASMVRFQPFWSTRAAPPATFDRLIDRFLQEPLETVQPARTGRPANLYESDEAYWVELALPGVKPDDVEITVQENVLTLKAKRNWQAPERARPIWQGFGPAEWRQSFTLPGEVNPDRVEATLEHGVLRLQVGKADHARPHTIKVNAGRAAEIPEMTVTQTSDGEK